MLTTFSGRRPSQNEYELNSFVYLLHELEVQSYCEIGAREGDTFHYVMRTLGPGGYGLAVDYPGALWGKKTTGIQLGACLADLNAAVGGCAECILGDSQSAEVIEAVRKRGPFDAILIDGDHTYAGVKADWENYRGLAPIIAFHDIVGTGQSEKVTGRQVEVPKLWAEIKAEGYRTIEFVDEGSAMGIGCVLL